jgi:hypothetical protein
MKGRAVFAAALALAVALAPLALADDKPAIKLNIPGADARPSTPSNVVITKTPPDPPPMIDRAQLVYDLRWDKGDVYLLGVRAVTLPAPQATPRAMGRFALELFEGPTLIERVRFDFPLLGAGEVLDAGRRAPPSFERKLTTRIGVMFPAAKRGTRLELWDRSTGMRWSMPWPPEAPATSGDAATGAPRDASIEGG